MDRKITDAVFLSRNYQIVNVHATCINNQNSLTLPKPIQVVSQLLPCLSPKASLSWSLTLRHSSLCLFSYRWEVGLRVPSIVWLLPVGTMFVSAAAMHRFSWLDWSPSWVYKNHHSPMGEWASGCLQLRPQWPLPLGHFHGCLGGNTYPFPSGVVLLGHTICKSLPAFPCHPHTVCSDHLHGEFSPLQICHMRLLQLLPEYWTWSLPLREPHCVCHHSFVHCSNKSHFCNIWHIRVTVVAVGWTLSSRTLESSQETEYIN